MVLLADWLDPVEDEEEEFFDIRSGFTKKKEFETIDSMWDGGNLNYLNIRKPMSFGQFGRKLQ